MANQSESVQTPDTGKKRWIKPLTKKQAEPECGCVYSITGMYALYLCPQHGGEND